MFALVTVSCVCAFISAASSSAIPMWEYLKRDEKTSYIYSLFASETEKYCRNDPDDLNCNQQLLKIGLHKLKYISEEELDLLDPYQRDASAMIWDTLLGGQLSQKNPAHVKNSTPTPNSYEDNLSFDVMDEFGSQEEESENIESYYTVEPPKDFVYVPYPDSESKLYINSHYPQDDYNPIKFSQPAYSDNEVEDSYDSKYHPTTQKATKQYSDESKYLVNAKYFGSKTKKPKKPEFKTELPYEVIYTNQKNSNFNERDNFEDFEYDQESSRIYLTGPNEVRVYPNGAPVPDEESSVIPQDEDLLQYKMQHLQVPRV